MNDKNGFVALVIGKDCAQIGAQPCMCLHMVLKLALIHPPSQEEADENGLPPALVCSFLGRFEYHMKTHTGLPHLPARNPWFAVRLLFANYEGT